MLSRGRTLWCGVARKVTQSLGGYVVEAGRPPHPQTEIEAILGIAESVGLIVTYHPVGFGCPGVQPGWFRIHCPRGCHPATRIDAQKTDRITQRQFFTWFTLVMTGHDKADVEGS